MYDQYMDSLDIPIDLIWEGKLEPLSPSQLALAANVEDILYFENDFTANLLPEELFESSILSSSLLSSSSSSLTSNFNSTKSAEALLFEIQADMIEAQKDTEQWSNQPVNISSMLNNYPSLITSPSNLAFSSTLPPQPPQQLSSQIRNHHVHHPSTVKIENTAQLLKEFDNVLNGIAQLTPPQSPPLSPHSIVAATASSTATGNATNQTSGYHHSNDYTHNNYNNNNNGYDQQSAYFYHQNPIVVGPIASSTNKYQPIEIIPSEQQQQQQQQYNNNHIGSSIYFGNEYNNNNNNNNGIPIQSSYASSLASPTTGSSIIGDPSECDADLNEVYEMEVVDELIRARSQNLPDWGAIITPSSSSPLSSSTLNDTENNIIINQKVVSANIANNNNNDIIMDDDFESIASNSSLSPRSESSDFGSTYSNDDEWKPNRILSSTTKKSSSSSSNAKRRIDDGDIDDDDDGDADGDDDDEDNSGHSSSSTSLNAMKKIQKKRRPYKRTKEDLKSRKKEQNKNAATRYRIKKKAEIEIILDEEQKLQLICDGLERKYLNVRREIKYLKGLMRDIFTAKGIL